MAQTTHTPKQAHTPQDSPLSDLNYDLLTILQHKLVALAAYETYERDCDAAGDTHCQELVAELKREDERQVRNLKAEVERIVKAGKFT
jgi:hypothetical protein